MKFTLHQYAKFVALATFLLIFAGGLVTSTGSGLSVPDWPLSFGKFFPEMKGGVRFEHGHRMAAGIVVILTVFLFVWIIKRESRLFVKVLVSAALGAIILQALLGGMTVLLKLPPAVSVAHAGLAQAFFCLVVSLAVLTSPDFDGAKTKVIITPAKAGIQNLCLITTAAVYTQILIGAVMRHIGAGLAIPDFPLAFGSLIPPRDAFTFPVLVNYAHRVGAVVVSVLVIWTAARTLSFGVPRLRKIAWTALTLLVCQITLGGLTVLSGKAVIPTTLHVAVGALLLATQVALFLCVSQFRKPAAVHTSL